MQEKRDRERPGLGLLCASGGDNAVFRDNRLSNDRTKGSGVDGDRLTTPLKEVGSWARAIEEEHGILARDSSS